MLLGIILFVGIMNGFVVENRLSFTANRSLAGSAVHALHDGNRQSSGNGFHRDIRLVHPGRPVVAMPVCLPYKGNMVPLTGTALYPESQRVMISMPLGFVPYGTDVNYQGVHDASYPGTSGAGPGYLGVHGVSYPGIAARQMNVSYTRGHQAGCQMDEHFDVTSVFSGVGQQVVGQSGSANVNAEERIETDDASDQGVYKEEEQPFIGGYLCPVIGCSTVRGIIQHTRFSNVRCWIDHMVWKHGPGYSLTGGSNKANVAVGGECASGVQVRQKKYGIQGLGVQVLVQQEQMKCLVNGCDSPLFTSFDNLGRHLQECHGDALDKQPFNKLWVEKKNHYLCYQRDCGYWTDSDDNPSVKKCSQPDCDYSMDLTSNDQYVYQEGLMHTNSHLSIPSFCRPKKAAYKKISELNLFGIGKRYQTRHGKGFSCQDHSVAAIEQSVEGLGRHWLEVHLNEKFICWVSGCQGDDNKRTQLSSARALFDHNMDIHRHKFLKNRSEAGFETLKMDWQDGWLTEDQLDFVSA